MLLLVGFVGSARVVRVALALALVLALLFGKGGEGGRR